MTDKEAFVCHMLAKMANGGDETAFHAVKEARARLVEAAQNLSRDREKFASVPAALAASGPSSLIDLGLLLSLGYVGLPLGAAAVGGHMLGSRAGNLGAPEINQVRKREHLADIEKMQASLEDAIAMSQSAKPKEDKSQRPW